MCLNMCKDIKIYLPQNNTSIATVLFAFLPLDFSSAVAVTVRTNGVKVPLKVINQPCVVNAAVSLLLFLTLLTPVSTNR